MKDDGIEPAGDEDIQRLLTLAGPRVQPPADVTARVRAATLAAFDAFPEPATPESVSLGRSAHLTRHMWTLAAMLLLVATAGYLLVRGDPPGPVGDILFATGGYTVRGAQSTADELMAGSIVRTSRSGRLLIGFGAERSIRVDQGSSLTLHSESEIWLHSGRVYVDASGNGRLTVVTPYASITDVGTQFEVTVAGESLGVATREGQVDVRLNGETIQSGAGPGAAEELLIEGLTLKSRTTVSTVGERWRWTQVSRPLFPVAERSVRDYLKWAARDSGKTLRFASELAEQQAGLRMLRGRGEVDADQGSIERVLAATSFSLLTGAPHELIVGLRTES